VDAVPAFQPARLFRLARKELTEILRDRRTIITLVVMPLLLYPLLGIGFGLVSQGGKASEVPQKFSIAFPTTAKGKTAEPMGVRLWDGAHALGVARPELLTVDDIDLAVREGQAHVGLRPVTPGDFAGDWDVVYRDDVPASREAAHFVQQAAAATDIKDLRAMMKRPPRQPHFVAAPLKTPDEERGALRLAVFVPLVLILMTMTGAVYPAIDLTAGERERGTLEVLIAAPVPRVSLLFGKYVAVTAVAVLTALVNLGSMTVSILVSGLTEKVFGPAGVRVLTLVEIFGLVLLFAAFFSAVLLVVTSFARSFKEAQAYLIPLMVVSLVPGIVGLLPGLSLSGPLAVVPLLNIVLLARDLLGGHADPVSAAVVVIVTAAYAVLALWVAAQVFGTEGVLYGESGGWRDFLRRVVRRQPASVK
jgi:ABC-2 type transport system permease protein/sodium transport system permease protein